MEYPNRRNMDMRRMQMFPAPGSAQRMSFQPDSADSIEQQAAFGQQESEDWMVHQSEAGGCGCMGDGNMGNVQNTNAQNTNMQNANVQNRKVQNPFMQNAFRPLEQSENFTVGMGYVPMQRWEQTYDMENGMRRGTIFPSLDLPFMMGRCR